MSGSHRWERWTTVVLVLLLVSSCAHGSPAETTGTLASVSQRSWAESEVAGPTTTTSAVAGSGERSDDDVRAAFDALMARRRECGRRPRDCDVDRLAVPGSSVHRALSETMADRVRLGIVATEDGSHRYLVGDVVRRNDDEVMLQVCHSDDVVLTMTIVPGGPAAVYDESWTSHESIWTMRSIDGEWRWTDEVVERRVYEEELCQ